MKIVIASGYFDPLNGSGHIEYLKLSKNIAGVDGKLIIIVNNDEQAILKKGKYFMKCDERINIIRELRDVDDVIKSIDLDRTVCKTIELVHEKYTNMFKNTNEKLDIWFSNGGDQFNDSIPEKPICEKLGIKLVDNLGEKISSSSWLTGLKSLR